MAATLRVPIAHLILIQSKWSIPDVQGCTNLAVGRDKVRLEVEKVTWVRVESDLLILKPEKCP